MTAIATYGYRGWPGLIGDLLISGLEDPLRSAGLPTIGAVVEVFPQGSGWTITGLRQKIAIVSDNCAVAWAGSQIGAQVAISQIREVAQSGNLTFGNLTAILDELDSDVSAKDVSLLGFLIQDGALHNFARNAENDGKTLEGDIVRSAGIGGKYLFDILTRDGPGRSQPSVSEIPLAQEVYERGLVVSGALMRTERPSGYTLRRYYGGGYEVAVYNGERFTKGLGITYVMWDAREPDRKGFANPTRIITYVYRDDALLIRSQELKFTSPRGFTFGEIQFHVINPIYRRCGINELGSIADFPVTTPWIVHCFLAGRHEKLHMVTLVQQWIDRNDSDFRVTGQNGVILRIDTKKEFWHKLAQVLENVQANAPPPTSPEDHWGLGRDA